MIEVVKPIVTATAVTTNLTLPIIIHDKGAVKEILGANRAAARTPISRNETPKPDQQYGLLVLDKKAPRIIPKSARIETAIVSTITPTIRHPPSQNKSTVMVAD